MLENVNYKIITKEKYEKILQESDKKTYYLYHYILYKCESNEIIKIDQIKDLEKIKDKIILTKYYIERIHYYNEDYNENYELGFPSYIYNLGYFYIDGFIDMHKEEEENVRKLFNNYDKHFKELNFPFTDSEFLRKNI